MKKDGFITMALIYTFLIIFVLLILSLLTAYSVRNKLINNQIEEVKNELNKEYE